MAIVNSQFGDFEFLEHEPEADLLDNSRNGNRNSSVAIPAPIGPTLGQEVGFTWTSNSPALRRDGDSFFTTLGDIVNLSLICKQFVEFGIIAVTERVVPYSSQGRPLDQCSVANFKDPDCRVDLFIMYNAVIGRARELSLIGPEPNDDIFTTLLVDDLRMVIEQILWEDELAELDGKDAPFSEIRRIKADTEARRKIKMDRMRQGGRIVARGDSLDEVMRKVRAQQKPDTI